MPERTAGSRKWWLEATYVTAVSAAIIVPGVTLLAHFLDYRLEAAKQEHAVELDNKKHFHEMRQTYLDRAIDPHRSSEYRRSVLTFLKETLADDEPMRTWAARELAHLEKALELEIKLSATERKTQDLTQQLSEARKSAGSSKQEMAELAQNLEATRTEVDLIWKDLKAAEKEANIASPFPAPPSGRSPPTSGRQEGGVPTKGNCCITCNGILVCGKSVTTVCGSCEGEGTS